MSKLADSIIVGFVIVFGILIICLGIPACVYYWQFWSAVTNSRGKQLTTAVMMSSTPPSTVEQEFVFGALITITILGFIMTIMGIILIINLRKYPTIDADKKEKKEKVIKKTNKKDDSSSLSSSSFINKNKGESLNMYD